ncbi:hypothetical protein BDZ89DRAFT_976213 [Hymenopellis radicata]|nr:hypothetical protein BDZ89DRAFT_976213 [Hymenopellis radicata]
MPGAYEKVFIPHLLSTTFATNAVCAVQRLPIQLLVDSVFPYLSVGDIIALRKLNHAFFLLTHEPVIWRRFLKTFNVQPPYIPAHVPYTLQASDFKAELMVANFLSVQQNWESSDPQLCGYYSFPTSCIVAEMRILPGGEYGVAAVCDEAGYRVMVTEMNGRFAGLASIATINRPYNLQARYMTYHGRQGIMVWFIVTSDIEKPSGIAVGHTCHVAHIGLDTLSVRSDKTTLSPEPFELLVPYTFADPVHDASVFMAGGNLYLAPVLIPNEVVIINIEANEARSIVLVPDPAYESFHQQIRTVRFLPEQGDVMVVRTVVNGPNDVHLLELFAIPQALGRFTPIAKSRVVISQKQVKTFQFSDVLDAAGSASPLPMSLYLETENPRSIIHYSISPVLFTSFGASPWWCYDLTTVVQQSASMHSQDVAHVLPGTHRALVCTVADEELVDDLYTPSTQLTGLRRYFNPEMHFPDLLSYPREALLRTQQLCGWRPKHLYRTIDISPHILGLVNRHKITSMAWDEASGRTCIATKHDGRIHMLEFGRSAGPDAHLERFDSLQKILRIGQYENPVPESPYDEMAHLDIIEMEDEPDDLYRSQRSLFTLLTYLVLGLASILSLYSSLCINVLLQH